MCDIDKLFDIFGHDETLRMKQEEEEEEKKLKLNKSDLMFYYNWIGSWAHKCLEIVVNPANSNINFKAVSC